LYREAKPTVIAAPERDEVAVVVVKMEVAGEVFWRWLAVKPAIPPALFVR
jgi:hypothetical protein